jgi:hypothetical protein
MNFHRLARSLWDYSCCTEFVKSLYLESFFSGQLLPKIYAEKRVLTELYVFVRTGAAFTDQYPPKTTLLDAIV